MANENIFACELCQKQFSNYKSFRRHSAEHNRKPLHACETCGRTFMRRDALKRHERSNGACQKSISSRSKNTGADNGQYDEPQSDIDASGAENEANEADEADEANGFEECGMDSENYDEEWNTSRENARVIGNTSGKEIHFTSTPSNRGNANVSRELHQLNAPLTPMTPMSSMNSMAVRNLKTKAPLTPLNSSSPMSTNASRSRPSLKFPTTRIHPYRKPLLSSRNSSLRDYERLPETNSSHSISRNDQFRRPDDLQLGPESYDEPVSASDRSVFQDSIDELSRAVNQLRDVVKTLDSRVGLIEARMASVEQRLASNSGYL